MPIVITRADGGVSIMGDGPDIERRLAAWKSVHVGEYVSHREVDASEVPTDRAFRNAWGHDLKVDMPKARELHREAMRAVRAKRMTALDVDYMRADEAGDVTTKTAIAAKKQALRDVTADPGIDKAKTPEQLKKVWPDVLR